MKGKPAHTGRAINQNMRAKYRNYGQSPKGINSGLSGWRSGGSEITKVLLLDNVDPAAKEILEKNGIEATLCKEKFSKDSLIAELQNYDGVVVRSATKVPADVIQACPGLKIIGRAGTGVDNIDIAAATKNGVAVMNTPGGNTISAAEHTCVLICCLSRNVPSADAHVKAGNWDRKAFMGHELLGKTLGIVGLGRIGLEVAKRMQSFGMTTIGYDPIVSAEAAKEYDVEWMKLENIWKLADYITVHTPLIPQTKGLINSKVFAQCKPGVKVINCARGGIIDEDDLLKALESGECGGAGLDVFVEEPTKNMALVQHPKVVACPHLGASTKEGQARCGREIAEQMAAVNCGKSYFGVMNAPALTAATSKDAKGWIEVAKSLAVVIKKFMNGGKYEVTLRVDKNLNSLSRALLAGVSCGLVEDNNTNLINASMLLSEQGLKVKMEVKDGEEGSCDLQVPWQGGLLTVSGKIAEDCVVLCAINGHPLIVPIPMQGCLLMCEIPAGSDKVQSVVSALVSEGIMLQLLTTTKMEKGVQWIVMGLSKAVSNLDVVNRVINGAVQIVY